MACLAAASGMAWGRMSLGEENPPGPSMATVPNLPSESTITVIAVAAETGAPWILSIKHLSLSWPRTLCTPEWWPMMMLLLAVVMPDPAILPMATWSLVVWLFWSARLPMAVLLFPPVLAVSASEPMAVLEPPVVLFMSAK